MYDVQGARSGLLPANYLGKADYTFSECIGLFSFYDRDSPNATPKVNATLDAWGFQVGRAVVAMVVVGAEQWWQT